MTVQVQLTAEQRRGLIIEAGVKLACDGGLMAVRHDRVALACAVPTSVATVRWYFRTNSELWAAIAGASSDDTVRNDAARLGLIDNS